MNFTCIKINLKINSPFCWDLPWMLPFFCQKCQKRVAFAWKVNCKFVPWKLCYLYIQRLKVWPILSQQIEWRFRIVTVLLKKFSDITIYRKQSPTPLCNYSSCNWQCPNMVKVCYKAPFPTISFKLKGIFLMQLTKTQSSGITMHGLLIEFANLHDQFMYLNVYYCYITLFYMLVAHAPFC